MSLIIGDLCVCLSRRGPSSVRVFFCFVSRVRITFQLSKAKKNDEMHISLLGVLLETIERERHTIERMCQETNLCNFIIVCLFVKMCVVLSVCLAYPYVRPSVCLSQKW